MCRNIKTLHHFDPPTTQEEIWASSLQFVRKLTGMQTPSKANQKAFDSAVDDITAITQRLFQALEVHTPPRSREMEKLKAAERGKKREEQLRVRYSPSGS